MTKEQGTCWPPSHVQSISHQLSSQKIKFHTSFLKSYLRIKDHDISYLMIKGSQTLCKSLVWVLCIYSMHLHIKLKPWLMTQVMSQQLASMNLWFHIQTWKRLSQIKSSLFLILCFFLIGISIKNTTCCPNSQPPTR